MQSPKQILVVEDNERNRKLFSLLIKSMGHDCLVATDGNVGIEVAKAKRPNLILMDIQMPVLDGLSALSLLKKDPTTKDIPVLAVTSYAMEKDRTRLLQAGFAGYLPKPIDTEQFKDIIEEALG